MLKIFWLGHLNKKMPLQICEIFVVHVLNGYLRGLKFFLEMIIQNVLLYFLIMEPFQYPYSSKVSFQNRFEISCIVISV